MSILNRRLTQHAGKRRKSEICEEILHTLPKWFGIDEALLDYVEGVKDLLFVSAALHGKVIGFCAVKVNYGINADLYVLGIFEEFPALWGEENPCLYMLKKVE